MLSHASYTLIAGLMIAGVSLCIPQVQLVAGWGPRAWKTGQHSATARNSATPVDSGAPPLTMKRTRPPKPARKRLNSSQSSIGEACARARFGAWNPGEGRCTHVPCVAVMNWDTLQRAPAADARQLAFRFHLSTLVLLKIHQCTRLRYELPGHKRRKQERA